jgi:hypothetical protein
METRPCSPEDELGSPENHPTIEPTGNRYCFSMGLLRVLYSWPKIGLGSTGNRTSGLHCTDPPMIGSSLSLSPDLSLFLSRHLTLVAGSLSLCRISPSVPISLSQTLDLSVSLCLCSLIPLSVRVSSERTRQKKNRRRKKRRRKKSCW